MGHLHEARLAANGPREGPLLVSEQLGLQELLGQRGAIDRHEGPGRPGAVGVNGAGDELLSRAGLAQDQDVRLRARRLPDELEDLGHGGATTDDVLQTQHLLELLAQVPVLEVQLTVTQGAFHRHRELVHRKVLRQVVERPFLDGGDRRFDRRERRDHDDGQTGIDVVRPTQQLHAIHGRHLEVGEQEIGRGLLEEREGSGAVGRRLAGVAGPR
jgi:hypothetical protein